MRRVTFALAIAIALVVAMPGPISAAPAYWEASLGTGLGQGEDDADFVSFGFTFYFYGVPYSGVWINSNGNMTLNDPNPSGMSPDIPEGSYSIIAPLYGDFNPWWDGDVYYNTLGEQGSRRFVVTWHAVPEFFWDGSNTFQAVLYEGTNLIQFGYNGLTTDGINWNGPPMAVGISSGAGPCIISASGTTIPALDDANIFYWWNGTDYVESTTLPSVAVDVDIDVKPAGNPNRINLKSKGVIPVAVLTTPNFDATTVDGTTVEFAGASPVHDQSDPLVVADHQHDVDLDGDIDYVFHFLVRETNIQAGDTEVELIGQTINGTQIVGSDSVSTVPAH